MYGTRQEEHFDPEEEEPLEPEQEPIVIPVASLISATLLWNSLMPSYQNLHYARLRGDTPNLVLDSPIRRGDWVWH